MKDFRERVLQATTGRHAPGGRAGGRLHALDPAAATHVAIVESSTGADAAVIDASMLAIHYALSPENVDALTA